MTDLVELIQLAVNILTPQKFCIIYKVNYFAPFKKKKKKSH